jgi:hypothetical protein
MAPSLPAKAATVLSGSGRSHTPSAQVSPGHPAAELQACWLVPEIRRIGWHRGDQVVAAPMKQATSDGIER